jgi:hypothetical protein
MVGGVARSSSQMNPYFLYKVTDYWDSNTDNLKRFCEELHTARPDQRKSIMEAIRTAVSEHVRVLSDETLCKVAWIMTEDLYRWANELASLSTSYAWYFEASAAQLLFLLWKRGYIMHYLAENDFPNTPLGMERPLDIFPDWFRSAGFVYICPQSLALEMMTADGFQRADFYDQVSRYIDEARDVTEQVAEECHSTDRHYFFLDTDSTEKSFGVALARSGEPGVITVHRSDAPVRGSTSRVRFPNAPKRI